MLLSETIQKSTTAIKLRRNATDNKAKAESYFKALTQLDQTAKSIEGTLKCAIEMKSQGIVSEPILAEATRADLLSCIDSCGNGVSPDSEEQLSLATVKLLQSKGDAIASSIKVVWKDAAANYAKGSTGYLSMIGSLTYNPKQAKDLVEGINKTVEGDPSIKSIGKLVADVAEAKKITDSFSIGPKIESFLKKVSSQQATVADLTPDVTAWLKEKKLMGKLKVRF